MAVAPRFCGDIGTMIRLSSFTPRMWLILVHDLLATAAAVVASFFIRFEEAGLAERWQPLVILLPVFLVYAAGVYVPLAAAIKIAAQFWRNHGRHDKTRFIALDGAFHGDTTGALALLHKYW